MALLYLRQTEVTAGLADEVRPVQGTVGDVTVDLLVEFDTAPIVPPFLQVVLVDLA
jgi:hypothetical protein